MKTYRDEIAYQTEGIYIDEAIVTVPQHVLDNVDKAGEILKNNPFIDYLMLDASEVDVEFMEDGNATDAFELGTDGILVSLLHGEVSMCYRVFNKWDSGSYLEVNLNKTI